MPSRIYPLITDQIYHVFNRSIERIPIFTNNKAAKRAIDTITYYRFERLSVRLSYFLLWSDTRQKELLLQLEKENKTLVTIICYCYMPNHFHFLLKQNQQNGISKFLSKFENSFTKYFNTSAKRKGHLFLGQFKAVRIETEEQLLHISRYIHLNPYSSFVVKNLENLLSYEWSSLPEYLGKTRGFCIKDHILSRFKKTSYLKFILDQADYQRRLETIKHLTLE
ncbi:transposase [Candidatus Gottesmanbacteria bacterium]|nr:transposase [Candidatus Gottesmanbacteria bacterium]MBI5452572.1 transposase [Candidatus Gottesmanbacteria bacterium]